MHRIWDVAPGVNIDTIIRTFEYTRFLRRIAMYCISCTRRLSLYM